MKALKIAVIVTLSLVLLIGIGLVIFLKTFNISRYKSTIVEQASRALGRPVDFKTIALDVSLEKGLSLHLTNLTIGDDLRFQKANLLELADVSLRFDVLSYLARRQVRVSAIQIRQPKLNIVRLKDGTVNLQTLGQSSEKNAAEKAATEASSNKSVSASTHSSTAALPLIFIDDVTLSDGKIAFLDQSVEPPVNLQISQLTVKIDGFSLMHPFSFLIDAALLNKQKNIHLEGKVQLNIPKNEVKLSDLKFVTDLGDLPLAQLRAMVPSLGSAPFPDTLDGKFQVAVKQLTCNPSGVGPWSMDLDWTEGSVSFKELTPGVSFAAGLIGLKVSNFSLNKPFHLALRAAYLSDQPNVSLDGNIQLYPEKQSVQLKDFKVSTDLSLLSLDRLKSSITAFKSLPLPDDLGGQFSTTFHSLSVGAQGLEGLRMDSQWSEGRIHFKQIAPGVSLDAAQIGLVVTDFSLTDPFKFSVRAAYLSNEPNLILEGNAQLDLQKQSVLVSNTKFSTDLADLSLSDLKSSITALKNAELPQSLKGQLDVNVDHLQVDAKGLGVLAAKGEFSGGAIKLKELLTPIDSIYSHFQATESAFDLKDLSFSLGKGRVKAQAHVDDYLKKQVFKASADAQDIDLSEVVDQSKQPTQVHGLISSKLTVQGQGFTPEAISKFLSGDGNVQMDQGRLTNLNVLKIILDKMSMIPDLAQRVQNSLPDRYKTQLNQNDTTLNKVQAKLAIKDGHLIMDPAQLDADVFLFDGQGQVGFDQSFAIQGPVFIPDDLSASMIQGVPELQYLLDEKNRIMIPASVSGKGQNIKFFVDMQYLGKKLIQNRGRQELEKVLNKVFDKGQGTQPANSDTTNPDGSSQQQTTPQKQIIDGILNSIFK